MNWKQLISAKRWGYEERVPYEQFDARSEFQRDYDRLIFSSPFRRLQNKTQVFPLPGAVFVHNRLTHSLEVASVGRSLGRIFYNSYKKQHPNVDVDIPLLQEIDTIIATACLAHDLGNPAFGHSGESAISAYFTGKGLEYKSKLTEDQWADLISFEGNANALRILTNNFNGKDKSGFALTYSSLAAIIKYPCSAIKGGDKKRLHRKKYGFFQSDKKAFLKIVNELDILKEEEDVYKRHPLVFLVEAADDICYNIIDLEDAHRLAILSYEEVEELLLPLCQDSKLKARLAQLNDEESRISLMRAKAISTLIVATSKVFFDEQEAILAGNFTKSLIDALDSDLHDAMLKIQDISYKKIYNASSVVEIEVAGYKVMEGILEEFVPAYLAEKPNNLHKKLKALMPIQFHSGSDDVYERIRDVLDFVSSMTDLYALQLYRKIKGIEIATL